MKQGKLQEDTVFFAGVSFFLYTSLARIPKPSVVSACSLSSSELRRGAHPSYGFYSVLTGACLRAVCLRCCYAHKGKPNVQSFRSELSLTFSQCLRPEFSCKLDQRQEIRVVELIKRLLQAIDMTNVGDADESTPRRRFARFLQQLVASRVWERRNGSGTCTQPSTEAGIGSGPSQPVPALVTPVGPQGPMGGAHVHFKMPQLDLPAYDMGLPSEWDSPAMHPDQMQSLFAFSETELMPTFMAFPDQSSSWFM